MADGWRNAPTWRPARLSDGFANAPRLRLAWPTEANEVFVVAPNAVVEAWRAAGAQFHDWTTCSLAPERDPTRTNGCSGS